ncbi:hypothetical protein HK096_001750, partial [Nowakowskiella sp. JEL0078]
GISFIFPVPTKFTPPLSKSQDLPISFPDGSTPVINRIYIFAGSTRWEGAIPPLIDSFEQREIVIEMGKGITIVKHNLTKPIYFKITPEETLLDFGYPQQISYRENNANLQIHQSSENEFCEDYLWNYFRSSFTLHFSPTTPNHSLKKITLHTNFPSHYTFHRYHRTPIFILHKGTQIDCLGRWDDIKRILGNSDGPPVVYDQSMQNNDIRASTGGGVIGGGSTLYYGYSNLGIIFE